MPVSLEAMRNDPEDWQEKVQRMVSEFHGAESYRREFGWTAEDYALDKKLWPEDYICTECGGEMAMKVSGFGEEQRMTFICVCGYVKERSATA